MQSELDKMLIYRRMIRLESILSDIYPALASRVITLQEAGEERAAEQWNEMCRKILVALEDELV